MGYTHFDKVAGNKALGVGVKDSEVVVADATGKLYQQGSAINANANELNLLANNSTYIANSGVWATYPAMAALKNPNLVHDYDEEFYEFLAAADGNDVKGYVVATVGTGTVTVTDDSGGILKLTTSAGQTDSITCTFNSKCFKVAENKPLWVETLFYLPDVTKCNFAIGLGPSANGLFFKKYLLQDGINNPLRAISLVSGTAVSLPTGAANYIPLQNNVKYKLGIYFNGTNTITFYVNDTAYVTITGSQYLPIASMDPYFKIANEFTEGDTYAARTAYIDYLKIKQLR